MKTSEWNLIRVLEKKISEYGVEYFFFHFRTKKYEVRSMNRKRKYKSNFVPFGFSNVQLNLSTRAFSDLAPIKKCGHSAGGNRTLDLVASCCYDRPAGAIDLPLPLLHHCDKSPRDANNAFPLDRPAATAKPDTFDGSSVCWFIVAVTGQWEQENSSKRVF